MNIKMEKNCFDQQFRITKKLYKKSYKKMNLTELLNYINSDYNHDFCNIEYGKNKIKFEKNDLGVTLYIKPYYYEFLQKIIQKLPPNLINLVINTVDTILPSSLLIDSREIYLKHKKFMKFIDLEDCMNFTNWPTTLKTIFFIVNEVNFENKNYGQLNFLFYIKKLPFGTKIKIVSNYLVYDVNFQDNTTIKFISGDKIKIINLSS